MSKADDVFNLSQGNLIKKYNEVAWIGDDGIKKSREPNDFYPTPPEAIYPLLEREKFVGEIWECACGDGAISKILQEKGHQTYSSDLIDRGFGDPHIDFLLSDRKTNNIITNPPFKSAMEFVYKANELCSDKFAFLCRINFLEGVARSKMFKTTPLKQVYFFSRRITFIHPELKSKTHGGGMLAFAWFVFEKGYQDKPTIDWI
jgi:hypothetical protein